MKRIKEEWPLSLDVPPSLSECKDFIRKSGLARNSREIVFKWQQLKKSL